MIIYIFGDVRQLHKYELAQPPISAPQPGSSSPFAHYSTSFSPSQSPVSASSLPTRPPPAHLAVDTSSTALQSLRFSSPSVSCHNDPPSPITPVQEGDEEDDDSGTDSDEDIEDIGEDEDEDDGRDGAHGPSPVIHISAAYCDDIPDPDALYEPGPQPVCITKDVGIDSSAETFPPTAAFIHRFNEVEQKQAMGGFDFASLPPRKCRRPSSRPTSAQQPLAMRSTSPQQEVEVVASEHTSWALPRLLIGRLQTYCTGSISLAHAEPSDLEKGTARAQEPPSLSTVARKNVAEEEVITARLKYIRSVPAFAVPLTRILSPVIARGQWLIVVRSAILSAIFCALVVGGLIAIPERV
jgi:hypothetical protein